MFRRYTMVLGVRIRCLLSLFVLVVVVTGVQVPNIAHAAITPEGDITPSGTWTSSTTGYIGNTASGTLTVNDGSSLQSSYGYIGNGSTATGVVNISGSGSTWTNNSSLYVGGYGSGTLSIMSGGSVSSNSGSIGKESGSTGIVTVSGTNSTWTNHEFLFVGYSGSGVLSIMNGGCVSDTISSSKGGLIGYIPGSTGIVTVNGTGSTWTNSLIYLGYGGSGTLSITEGGSVSSYRSYIGNYFGSTGIATVDGTGSTWTNGDELCVGYHGGGTLSITNGGYVSVAGSTFIGTYTDSTGMIDFGTNGGSLTTRSLFASPSQLAGTGTIVTRGLVSDVDLIFGSTSDLQKNFMFQSAGQRVAVNLDMTGGTSTNGDLGAGWNGTGSLTIKNGITVNSNNGYIGYGSGSTGVATVSGPGSTWNNRNDFHVGYSGSGSLSIVAGGCVNSGYDSYIGRSVGSMGIVTVDGTGSTWTNSRDFYVGYGGSGALSITSGGSASGNNSYIGYIYGSTGAVTVDGTGSTWTNSGCLCLGFESSGTLSITRGGRVTSSSGQIGGGLFNSWDFATGAVVVDGAGSNWTNIEKLYVGCSGSGTLSITNGGSVSNSDSYIGNYSGSTGIVTVDGTGSTWTNNGRLDVGHSGTGTLSITGGGAVTAMFAPVGRGSLVTIDVGRGSSLKIGGGTGTISNGGTIRIVAGAGVAADATQYSPIVAGTWSGTGGKYQAVGGTWSSTNHTFTASSVAAGTSSVTLTLDRAAKQRVLITDNASGGTNWKLGASFLGEETTSNMTFTATAAMGTTLDALKTAAGSDQTVLGGWTFTTTDYTLSSSLPAYFSFNVGDYSSDELKIWGFDGSDWTAYTANDLTCDGTYASFTATGLNGYAVTVPEPGTLALLAAGLLGFLAYRRKRA